MTDRKVALITGITGQDGSYLAELLIEKGYTVRTASLVLIILFVVYKNHFGQFLTKLLFFFLFFFRPLSIRFQFSIH